MTALPPSLWMAIRQWAPQHFRVGGRPRCQRLAATDSAKAAIAVISRYDFALSASVINDLSDASARSSTSSALSMNDMT